MAPGSLLSLTATNGQVYYTLDGTDPRLAGGAIAPGARLYGSPLTLPDSVVVKARVLSGSQWSTLSEATFFLPPDWSKLLVTEIMYHPPDFDAVGDEFEFLELKNAGTTIAHWMDSSSPPASAFTFTAARCWGPANSLCWAPTPHNCKPSIPAWSWAASMPAN